MRNYTKGTAIALLLSGAALASVGTAGADDYYGRDRANSTISVQFGNVSMGYRDGYYDNNHNWHRWDSDNDYRVYRYQHADTYRDWDHDRDANNATVSVSFGDVSVGYRDGYFDRNHNFYRWRGDRDYQDYRDRYPGSYRDYDHDRDSTDVIGISFGDIAFGSRDGYCDNGHRWHRWNSDSDYRRFRYQYRNNYHNWGQDRCDSYGMTSISFGDIAFGSRDGYCDNGRRWHRWNSDGDYRRFRYQYRSNYRNWGQDRCGNYGVIGISFGNVAIGYRDGYWDNDHRWHRWSSDNDYQNYRSQHGSNYRDWDHDRDGGDGWQQH